MKIKRYLMLVAACTLFLGKSFAANNEKPFVIPELQEWRGAQGMFTPSATSRIVYASKDPAVAGVSWLLCREEPLPVTLFSPYPETNNWVKKDMP